MSSRLASRAAWSSSVRSPGWMRLLGDHVVVERVHLLAAQVVDHGPQVGFFGLDPFGKAALGEPVEDLGHDEGIQAAQAHLAAETDCRLGPPPSQLVQGRVGPACVTQPELVGLAVATARVAALMGAGRHQTRPQGGPPCRGGPRMRQPRRQGSGAGRHGPCTARRDPRPVRGRSRPPHRPLVPGATCPAGEAGPTGRRPAPRRPGEPGRRSRSAGRWWPSSSTHPPGTPDGPPGDWSWRASTDRLLVLIMPPDGRRGGGWQSRTRPG